jgi:hypothetical protein
MTEVPTQEVITAWMYIEDILRCMAKDIESAKGLDESEPTWQAAQYAHYMHKNLKTLSSHNKTVDRILLPRTGSCNP